MKYILEGNDKELERVIKESRVRMNRGLISITPLSGCGLITEEDARKTLEEQLGTRDAKIQELTAILGEKNALISSLEGQCEKYEARIAELESFEDALMGGDDKGLLETDSTVLPELDSKELVMGDSTALSVPDVKEIVTSTTEASAPVDVKKPGRPKNSN